MKNLALIIIAIFAFAACKKDPPVTPKETVYVHDTTYLDFVSKLYGTWKPVDSKYKTIYISKDSISFSGEPGKRYICTADSIMEVYDGNRFLGIYKYSMHSNYDSMKLYSTGVGHPIYHYYKVK